MHAYLENHFWNKVMESRNILTKSQIQAEKVKKKKKDLPTCSEIGIAKIAV